VPTAAKRSDEAKRFRLNECEVFIYFGAEVGVLIDPDVFPIVVPLPKRARRLSGLQKNRQFF
jgi:hypothetical protein